MGDRYVGHVSISQWFQDSRVLNWVRIVADLVLRDFSRASQFLQDVSQELKP